MASDGFSELLQKAEELCSTFDNDVELPRVERSLHQILDAGQKLWSKSQHAASEDSVNVKAATLLGPKGCGIPQISQKLESLSSVKTYDALEPARDTDVRAFLKNERDNALLAAIETSKRRTFTAANTRHWDSMKDEWEMEKQRLLNALLGSQQEATLDFSLDHSAVMGGGEGAMTRGSSRSAMNATELAYAQQIYLYNEDLIAGGTVSPLILKMMEVAEKLNDEHIRELWNMVEAVSSIPSVMAGSIAASKVSKATHQALVSNSKRYLEKSYERHIKQTINKNLQAAMLGGIPGTIQLVKSYLNVALSPQNPGLEDGLVAEQPVWPMIYFCLRCGDSNAAVILAEEAAPSIGEFSSYMKEYAAHGCLSRNSVAKMRLQYRRQVCSSTDPFKRLMFCAIGCCDVTDAHSDVAEKIDDFLWLRLTQIQSGSDSPQDDAEVLRLPQLQKQLLEDFGEMHFQAQQRPLLYFQVLLLTGQFEAALEFLSRHDRLQAHAVHVALALYELNLLLLPTNIQTHLLSRDTSDSLPLRRLNLARLVMMYTRKFEATDPREALQYFYFLRNIKSHGSEKSLFTSCVSELVLETREFDMLLGRMERTGRRKPGAIDKFQSDTKSIIETVAADTEKKGMFEEAVKLYDLAQSHEKALRLLSQLLSSHLSEPSVSGSAKDRIHSLALDIAKRYKSYTDMSKQTSGTFYLLLDLALFFEQYHSEQMDKALDIIKQLKILPSTLDTVEQRVNSFKYYENEIRQALPDILLATMNILLTLFKKMRPVSSNSSRLDQSTSFSFVGVDDGGRNTVVSSLREHARALITFAGMMPYRLPGDTSARMVQMEVLMN
ncbi:nuclear pore complex protein Nup93-like [Watersipora subatra]|uniref:nuclear pore complex protein Nup93-like n=1 Tax=Watersipora subatra TaxID=2589382 RepID=UPI00355AF4C7